MGSLLIFAAEADFEAAIEKAKALADTLEKTYKNALTTPESIAECLALYEGAGDPALPDATSYTSPPPFRRLFIRYRGAEEEGLQMTALAAEIRSASRSSRARSPTRPKSSSAPPWTRPGAGSISCGDPPREARSLSAETEKARRTQSGIQRPYDIYHTTEARRYEFGSSP